MRAQIAAVIVVLALAGCGGAVTSATSPTPITAPATSPTAVPPTAFPLASNGDLGATVPQFKAAHRADSGPGAICTATNACFGRGLTNAETGPAPTYEFVNVSVSGGIVSGYSMEFPDDTSILAAKSYVLEWLPRDATTTYYKIDHANGSCVQWNVTSPTLARELATPKIGDPHGDLGITLGYVDANLNQVYDANNVEHADISVLPDSPTDTC
jgi:hypothetical protein